MTRSLSTITPFGPNAGRVFISPTAAGMPAGRKSTARSQDDGHGCTSTARRQGNASRIAECTVLPSWRASGRSEMRGDLYCNYSTSALHSPSAYDFQVHDCISLHFGLCSGRCSRWCARSLCCRPALCMACVVL